MADRGPRASVRAYRSALGSTVSLGCGGYVVALLAMAALAAVLQSPTAGAARTQSANRRPRVGRR